MGFWSRLFGKPAAPTVGAEPVGHEDEDSPVHAPNPRTFPPVEALPGQLVVRVVAHHVPAGPRSYACWTYISEGLSRVGQEELVFTLRRRRGEAEDAFPTDPIMFFRQVYSLAEQKRIVGPWAYTVFGSPRGFLGFTQHIGFAYARPEALPGVELPPLESSLALTLLLPTEAEVVERVGPYRILSLLGIKNRYYPYPSWSDRDRAPVADVRSFELSQLSKLPALTCHGASVRTRIPNAPTAIPGSRDRTAARTDDAIELRLPRGRGAELANTLRSLGTSSALTLRTDPDPQSDVRLVWEPGQTEPLTITPDGSLAGLMTGGFLMCVFGSGISDGARVIEDGFALTCGSESWQRILNAVATEESMDLVAQKSEGKSFLIRWVGSER